MKRRNFNKSILQQGGLMIEALAMLGLIAVVTPTMYKKSAERTMEVEDINTAATIRTINAAANDYVSANYSTILGDMVKHNETNRKLNIEDLKAYLPYGFDIKKALYNYDGEHIQLSVSRPDGSNNLTTLMLFPAKLDEENGIGQERTSRIAALIGSSGGYVTDNNKARGIGGIWELSGDNYTKNFNSANKYSIVTASADTISASAGNEMDYSKYLQRGKDAGDDEGQWKNTMRTDLYMGGPEGSSEDVYREATGPWSIRNINRLIVGTDYVGGNKETEDATNYSLYVAGNKPNTYLSGTLEAVDSDFKVLQNQLSFGRTVNNPDADPADQTKSDYAFTIANNGDTSTRGQLIVDRNVTLAGSAGFWNDVKIGVIDKYPSATEPNYGIRIKPFADKTSEKDNNDAPWGRVTFFADNIMQINNTGNNDAPASDNDRILIMNDGIKELPDGTAVPTISYNNTEPTFPMRVGANAKFEGLLTAGQIDTQKMRLATLSAGSEHIDDDNKWMTVDKDGVRIKYPGKSDESGTYATFDKDNIFLRIDTEEQALDDEYLVSDHPTQLNLRNYKKNKGTGKKEYSVAELFSDNTDVRGYDQLKLSGGGIILQADGSISYTGEGTEDAFLDKVDQNTLLLRNNMMQLKMKGNELKIGGKTQTAESDQVASGIDPKENRVFIDNGTVDVANANLNVYTDDDTNKKQVFSVRTNDDPNDNSPSNTYADNYDITMHGKVLITNEAGGKLAAGNGDANQTVNYVNVGDNIYDKAGINIIDNKPKTKPTTENPNPEHVQVGDAYKKILTIEQGATDTSNHNSNSNYVDPGTIYIRKGYVEVHGNDKVYNEDGSLTKTEANKGNGVLVASRLVANNPIQARDVTKNIPERGSHITEFVDSSNYDNGSNHYDTYMVNPAYTSVMHDIKLTTRGGARLSDILPDFINKGIYVVSNTIKENFNNEAGDLEFNGYNGSNGAQLIASANSVNSTEKINFANSDAWASPYLGSVPAPQCPPGYGRVITLTPYSFEMAQAGILNKTQRAINDALSTGENGIKNGTKDSYYVMPVNNANEVKSSLTPPEYAKANVALDGNTDIKITATNNNIGTINGTLDELDGLSTQQYVLSSPTATDNSTKPVKPLCFKQSTRIKSATVPLVDGLPTSLETKPSALENEYVSGWAAIIGFIYPAKMYSAFTGNDNSGFYWNLFPVMRGTINGYATVYCYFDRTNMYGKYNSNYGDYVDKQDYMKTMTKVPSSKAKAADPLYKARLNDPNLKYDEVW